MNLNKQNFNFYLSWRYLLNTKSVSSWCRIFSSRSRSCAIWIESILKVIVYCCHSDIVFFFYKLHFDKLQFIVNHWWKFCGDRTRIKTLLRRLKNIGMVCEKLYRNTLTNVQISCYQLHIAASVRWSLISCIKREYCVAERETPSLAPGVM